MKWKIGIGFTSKCNMKCKFCYSKKYRNIKSNKINYEKLLEFISYNRGNIDAINYGTGECVLEDKWWDFIQEVRRLNKEIKQGITTNGSLYVKVRRDGRKEILKNLINDVDISIDLANPNEHNFLRGHPKAFEFATKSLAICDELDIEKSIVMVATPKTFQLNNLEKLVELCNQYHCNLRINIYRPISVSKNQFIISPDQLYNGLIFLLKHMKILSISDNLFSSLLGEKKYKGDFTGYSSCRILNNGFITPGTYLITKGWFSTNIFDNPYCDLDNLHNTPQFRRILLSPIPQKCLNCEFMTYCRGGSYDRRWLFHKTLELPDPYCPFYLGKENPFRNISLNYSSKNSLLVHDGYLPTMIFTPHNETIW